MSESTQRLIGLVIAILTLPLVFVLALAVKLDRPGPAFYRAIRIGRNREPFRCLKLRTMSHGGAVGMAVTGARDTRITRVGAVLRRFRLDELPQFWNVALGDMRLVGPRPEAPEFVDLDDPLHVRVFSSVPGITGLTQLIYVEEASMLDGPNPEGKYRSVILPAKLRIDLAYLECRSPALDLWILGRTIGALAGRALSIEAAEARLGRSLRESWADARGGTSSVT